jgi:hypothetical protein
LHDLDISLPQNAAGDYFSIRNLNQSNAPTPGTASTGIHHPKAVLLCLKTQSTVRMAKQHSLGSPYPGIRNHAADI